MPGAGSSAEDAFRAVERWCRVGGSVVAGSIAGAIAGGFFDEQDE